MYAIKLTEDKVLETTVFSTIYRGEKDADVLVFLIPKTYGEVSLANCTVLLRYILPNGTGVSEKLAMYPLPYNKEYYQFKLGVDSRFTDKAGDIELWLTVIDMADEVVLKTGSTVVTITPCKEIDDYLPPSSLGQLDQMALKLEKMQKSKADSLTYDKERRALQLTADGVEIGDPVTVPADDYECATTDTWEDMTSEGDDDDSDEWEPM